MIFNAGFLDISVDKSQLTQITHFQGKQLPPNVGIPWKGYPVAVAFRIRAKTNRETDPDMDKSASSSSNLYICTRLFLLYYELTGFNATGSNRVTTYNLFTWRSGHTRKWSNHMEIKCKEQSQAHMMKGHDVTRDRTGRMQFYYSRGQWTNYLSYQYTVYLISISACYTQI